MPIYSYRCMRCRTVLEERRSMSRRNDEGSCSDKSCHGRTRRDLKSEREATMFAEVRGTGNGRIGRGLMDRAALAEHNRSNWKGGL